MSSIPIDIPASFVPAVAISVGQPGAEARFVDAANPMPVQIARGSATAAPLTGTASASAQVGPFFADLDRPIHLSLAGIWAGRVRLLRSIDGGATREPLTLAGMPWASFTANANEPVAEESVAGASYYLDLAITAGTVAYRVTQ